MKIYLAGGMTVMNMKGRERILSQKFDSWKRVFSYFYKELIFKSEILIIAENDNKQSKTTGSSRNS
jgi:hypothetical protein